MSNIGNFLKRKEEEEEAEKEKKENLYKVYNFLVYLVGNQNILTFNICITTVSVCIQAIPEITSLRYY